MSLAFSGLIGIATINWCESRNGFHFKKICSSDSFSADRRITIPGRTPDSTIEENTTVRPRPSKVNSRRCTSPAVFAFSDGAFGSALGASGCALSVSAFSALICVSVSCPTLLMASRTSFDKGTIISGNCAVVISDVLVSDSPALRYSRRALSPAWISVAATINSASPGVFSSLIFSSSIRCGKPAFEAGVSFAMSKGTESPASLVVSFLAGTSPTGIRCGWPPCNSRAISALAGCPPDSFDFFVRTVRNPR